MRKIQTSCGGWLISGCRSDVRATSDGDFFWRPRLSPKQSIDTARRTIAAAAAVRGPRRATVRAASSCPCSAFRFCQSRCRRLRRPTVSGRLVINYNNNFYASAVCESPRHPSSSCARVVVTASDRSTATRVLSRFLMVSFSTVSDYIMQPSMRVRWTGG